MSNLKICSNEILSFKNKVNTNNTEIQQEKAFFSTFSHAKGFSNILTGFFLISGTDVTDRQHLGNSNDAHL